MIAATASQLHFATRFYTNYGGL